MATRVFSPLLAGALWALPAAVLATVSPISAALFAVLGLLMAVLRLLPCPRAGLLALPAYLA
ncbi:MAG: ABC transporter permease, partial [Planctomycetota bacterium]